MLVGETTPANRAWQAERTGIAAAYVGLVGLTVLIVGAAAGIHLPGIFYYLLGLVFVIASLVRMFVSALRMVTGHDDWQKGSMSNLIQSFGWFVFAAFAFAAPIFHWPL